MQRRLRQACTAIREHSAVGYAKIATIGGFCNVELMIIKATSPDDIPLPEKYVHELVKIISFSASTSRVFSLSFTRRFCRTRCWRVALKCLVLLHRLLRSLPESNSLRSDLLWARSNGLLCLYPCRFRDLSSSSSEDYGVFVRSYAHLLDEALDCFSFSNCTEPGLENMTDKMREIARVLELLPQLQSLIDRVMECEPTGAARTSFIVRWAMKQILRDSFLCYATFCRDIVLLLDNLFQMQYRSSVSTMQIYKKAAIQANKLGEFYNSCRSMGLCGSYEYPFIDKIPPIHVRALESFLQQMWQLTESSSSPSMTTSTSESPPSTLTDEGSDQQTVRLETVIRTQWEKFEKGGDGAEEEEPLIRLDDNSFSEWEVLLEASANQHKVPRCLQDPFSMPTVYGYGDTYSKDRLQPNESTFQLHNPNPFTPYHYDNTLRIEYGGNMSSYGGPAGSPRNVPVSPLWYSYPPYMLSPASLPYLYHIPSPYTYPPVTPSVL
ncbi:putative clathrin assembly protein At1g03050 [Aristolochia californica]|uniref:putative clathrin assembly protein At1g03050 n=1 Tax=Aristolochia californica TaxID=171875 RepID=UPI0035DF3C2F